MTIRAYSITELENAVMDHLVAGHTMKDLMNDLGDDRDLLLEFDSKDGPFQYLLDGTDLSLEFDSQAITLLQFDFATGEEVALANFSPSEIRKATHCLLTTANQAK
jgi:hypothetical protein